MIFVPSLPKSWLLQAAKCRLVGMLSLSRHQSLARLKPRKRSSWLDYCGGLGLHVSFRTWRILASSVRSTNVSVFLLFLRLLYASRLILFRRLCCCNRSHTVRTDRRAVFKPAGLLFPSLLHLLLEFVCTCSAP